jgi:MFS transporter, FSR family, fosmidomycin resistance protein
MVLSRAMRWSPRLALLTASHFAIDSYSSFLTPLLPLLMRKLDLNLTLVGALVALFSLTSSFAQPLFGVLSDRMRRPWFILLGPVVAGVFLSSVGLASSYGMLIALVMLGGLGAAAFHPQAAVLAGSLLERRGLAMSVFVSGGTAGFSIGPLVAVGIVGAFGLSQTWWWGISALPLGALLLFWFRRMAPSAPRPIRAADWRELRPVAAPLGALYMSAVCRSATSYGFMTFLPLHLASRGHSFEFGGLALSAYLTAGAFGAFVGGWLADRWGGRRVIMYSFVGAMPLYMAYVFFPESIGLPCVVLASFVLQTGLPVVVVMGQQIAPRHASTVSSMLMGAAWGMSMMLVGPAGALADRHGIPASLAALTALLIVGLFFAVRLPDSLVPEHAGGIVPA